MTAKDYLSQAKCMERRINALLERRERCRDMARALALGRRTAIEALERELGNRIDAYAALVCQIDGAIDALDSAQDRDVLRYRYLNGWSWQRISGEMRLSKDRLWHLHARALEAMGDYIEC